MPFLARLLRGTLIHDLEKLHLKYGPIMRIAPDEVAFAHPDAWTEIMQPRQGKRQFLKDAMWWSTPNNKSMMNAIDVGDWARMRKTLTPGFTKGALRMQEAVVQRYVSLLIERLRERVHAASSGGPDLDPDKRKGVTVDVFPWVNFLTFDVFGDLGFGESFRCLENGRYHPWITLIFDNVKGIAFVNAAKYYPALDWVLQWCIPASLRKVQVRTFATGRLTSSLCIGAERRKRWRERGR